MSLYIVLIKIKKCEKIEIFLKYKFMLVIDGLRFTMTYYERLKSILS